MIIQASTLTQLNFSQLMDVYEEGNRENGLLQYSHLSTPEQLLAAEQDFYDYLKQFFSSNGCRYIIQLENERYVAALRLEPYKDGLLLEALETMPSERRRGFARKLIMQTIGALKHEEFPLYSHILKTNIPSILVHEACGFKKILDYGVYIDGSVNQNTYTYRFIK